MGLSCGNTVLTVAVLAILTTAPLGAFAIDRTYRRLLPRSEPRRSAVNGADGPCYYGNNPRRLTRFWRRRRIEGYLYIAAF